MRYAFVLASLVSAGALEAQQSSLVGTWRLSYTAGMTVEGGVQTPLLATATLVIQAEGDSLVGTLTNDPNPELPARPPARMTAPRAATEAAFVSRTKATINVNGDERETTAVSTWKLAVTGDSIAGTVDRRLEDVTIATMPTTTVSGTRKKS